MFSCRPASFSASVQGYLCPFRTSEFRAGYKQPWRAAEKPWKAGKQKWTEAEQPLTAAKQPWTAAEQPWAAAEQLA